MRAKIRFGAIDDKPKAMDWAKANIYFGEDENFIPHYPVQK